MNKALLTLAFMACILNGFADGTETQITIDIARRTASISLNFTACCDYAIRAAVRNNGDDFACAGYEVNLVLGGTTSGCIYEGRIENVNEIVFDVPASSMPTNGKYTVQIMAMKNRVSNEWGRGTLRVNMNPGMNYMPTCWMGYEKIARLAASMIAADMITNDVYAAILTDINSRFVFSLAPATNECVKVLSSTVSNICWGTYFHWTNDTNGVSRYVHKDFPGSYFDVPTNGNFMEGSFSLERAGMTAEHFSPSRINGKVVFRSTKDTGRYMIVRGGYCTDARRKRDTQTSDGQ